MSLCEHLYDHKFSWTEEAQWAQGESGRGRLVCHLCVGVCVSVGEWVYLGDYFHSSTTIPGLQHPWPACHQSVMKAEWRPQHVSKPSFNQPVSLHHLKHKKQLREDRGHLSLHYGQTISPWEAHQIHQCDKVMCALLKGSLGKEGRGYIWMPWDW